MPYIYLSPSTQEFNPYVIGGSEEYYMNLIADAMEPYLYASGISFSRNTPQMTAASSITDSNSKKVELHVSLHSNATASGEGKVRGSEVYYYPTSVNGKRMAEIAANNLKFVYPLPERVKTVPSTAIGELRRTKAPAILYEFAYHDNIDDALWIRDNINRIAANVVVSICDYFGIPFKTYK